MAIRVSTISMRKGTAVALTLVLFIPAANKSCNIVVCYGKVCFALQVLISGCYRDVLCKPLSSMLNEPLKPACFPDSPDLKIGHY